MKIVFVLLILALIIPGGCAKMRDYTFNKDGYFGFKLKKRIGEGQDFKKDYYLTAEGISLIVRDTKNEVITKLGLPDEVDRNVEDYDIWLYKERKLKLFFDKGYLNSWDVLP